MSRFIRTSVAVLCACVSIASCEDSPTDANKWTLQWQDEFDGAAGSIASAANWKFDVGTDWGNAQLEYDTDRAENASLDGAGNLVITAKREAYRGSAYTSARITTQGKQSFKYGKFEARMKLPSGRGLWPAFWLLGANLPTVGWPAAGEIDIMEYRGQEPSTVIGTIHGPGYSGGAAVSKSKTLVATRLDNSFHIYTVEWSADRIDFFIDGTLYHAITKDKVPGPWVFDKPMFIILNVAVGGAFVGPPDVFTPLPQTMVVDWVRVYSLTP
jgi:beta-glucanase (GH16 family)